MKEYYERVADAVTDKLASARHRGEKINFAGTIWDELDDFVGDRERAFHIVQKILSRRSAEKRHRKKLKREAAIRAEQRKRETELSVQLSLFY